MRRPKDVIKEDLLQPRETLESSQIMRRSKDAIKEDLFQAREALELSQREVDYNGDSGAERYLFFNALSQIIEARQSRVSKLEKELEPYLQEGETHSCPRRD